jgi:hypothetical protein
MLQFFCCLFDCHFELICHCYTYPVAFFNLVHLHRKLVLGDERLWVDVIVVCPFVHNFILHGLLSGFRRPSQQKSTPTKYSSWLTFGAVSLCY